MGGFNENSEAMYEAMSDACARDRAQGLAGSSLGSAAGLQQMQQMGMAQNAYNHQSEMARAEHMFREREAETRARIEADNYGRMMESAAKANLNRAVKLARNIDECDDVRKYLQLETDDWLRDAIKIN